MAKYRRKIALPTVLLILFLAFVAYFVNRHWGMEPALQSGVGHIVIVVIGVLAALVVFDVVVGGIFWLIGMISDGLKDLFKK